MEFLELINRCLLELNYRQVNAIAELTKNDQKRIAIILNLLNKEVCNSDCWNFLLRTQSLILPAQTSELKNTIDGRILYPYTDGVRYEYTNDVEPFLKGNPKQHTYSSFSDKLLFPKFNEDKIINVVFYTKKCVKDVEGNEKSDFENEKDKSVIPMPYAEQVLVYGTCLRLKANPQYFRFPYWMSMYKEALCNLKSKADASVLESPTINLFRK